MLRWKNTRRLRVLEPRRAEEIALDRARSGAPIFPDATERQSAPTELTVAGGPRDAMGRAARHGNFVAAFSRWSAAMPQPNDLSRSLVALDQNSTIIAVVELSHSSWLVA